MLEPADALSIPGPPGLFLQLEKLFQPHESDGHAPGAVGSDSGEQEIQRADRVRPARRHGAAPCPRADMTPASFAYEDDKRPSRILVADRAGSGQIRLREV